MAETREVKTITKRKGISHHQLKRVCAYIRVSTGHDLQLNSLENQEQYFKRLITSHPDYEFCGIYSDAGVSGAKNDRPGFNAMMEAARNQKIDLIITKTISRFARNTMFLLETIRELKQLNVGVIFEENHINTLHAEGELMLTVLGSLAEAERKSVSQNIKWSIQKNYQAGKTLHSPDRVFGYTSDKNRNPVIKPDEADIVRLIFKRYLSGISGFQIAKDFNEEKVPIEFKRVWISERILRVISNEKYMGDCLLQKSFVDEKGNQKRNKGQKNKYYVRGCFPPIIDQADWFKAQELRKTRSKKTYPFSGRFICPYCLQTLIRVTGFKKQIFWICQTYMHQGKSVCKGVRPKEKILIELLEDQNLLNTEMQIIVEEQCHGKNHHPKTKKDFSLRPVSKEQ
ncbi:recombinase family protein [Acetobacterium wieringae]|uniref:recombinase family protein n=1 Tax=Acetobacterium wieringae TaxID=52694 RepID=UPI0026EC8B90|nr:recombinase family protein [Acetobacterium wieringae]